MSDKKPDLLITPKARLLQDSKLVERLSEITRSPDFINAVNVILAEMVWQGTSAERLEGAKAMARQLVGITEPEKQSKPLPRKSLVEG